MADEKPVFSLTAFATWFLFIYFYLFLQMCFTKLRARKVWNNLSKAMQAMPDLEQTTRFEKFNSI